MNNSTIAWKTRARIPLGEAEPAGAPSSTCTRDSTRCRSSSSMRSLPESSGRSCATEAGGRKPWSRRRTTDVSPAEGVPKGLATRGADAAGMGRVVVPRRRIARGRAKRRGVLRGIMQNQSLLSRWRRTWFFDNWPSRQRLANMPTRALALRWRRARVDMFTGLFAECKKPSCPL